MTFAVSMLLPLPWLLLLPWLLTPPPLTGEDVSGACRRQVRVPPRGKLVVLLRNKAHPHPALRATFSRQGRRVKTEAAYPSNPP